MIHPIQNPHEHPIIYMVKNIIHKLIQHPDIYPIKYYKKSDRLKKNRRTMMG